MVLFARLGHDYHRHEPTLSLESEGMRDAVKQFLAVEQIERKQDGKCVGCVVYVYKHSERVTVQTPPSDSPRIDGFRSSTLLIYMTSTSF
jgi:hypothetical protein